MKSFNNFIILNTNETQNIIKFEKSFFQSFVNINNQLIHLIWDWDWQEQRLKTRIAYHDQIIYILEDDSQEIIAAIATNINSSQSQFSEFGFKFPPETAKYCEVLTLFMHPQANLSVFQLRDFVQLCTTDSSSRGFQKTYATCSKRLLRLYQRIGVEIIDKTIIQGEERYFIRLDH